MLSGRKKVYVTMKESAKGNSEVLHSSLESEV